MPFSENWVVGNEFSSFVSDSGSISTYLVVCDDKKQNLLLNAF